VGLTAIEETVPPSWSSTEVDVAVAYVVVDDVGAASFGPVEVGDVAEHPAATAAPSTASAHRPGIDLSIAKANRTERDVVKARR